MKVIRETTVAGKTILRTVKLPSGNHGHKRKGRCAVTRPAVLKNNFRLAVKKLTIILNANFDESCTHVTLTYKDVPRKEEAKKDRALFISKMRRKLKKEGKDLKYIMVTEYENKRIHHHIVINSQDIALINSMWNKGWVKCSALDNNGNYRKLAEYLIKETEKTFRKEDSVHKHRYSRSRNLIVPITKREVVSARELSRDPKPLKGYYIPPDEIRKYEHPVTGLEHLEYVMIADGTQKMRRNWSRGKAVEIKEYYKVTEGVDAEDDRWI